MNPLHTLTASGLAAAFRTGATTPTDAVEHFLGRIEAHSETVGAFVTVTADSALASAAVATRAFATQDHTELPPLYGVPTAVKDLSLTAGVRTMFGSQAMTDYVPSVSDAVVDKIAAAGMISLGKTNTPEFGTPCYTEPDVAPPARTPYDLERSAGGSSGGAAAAVAAGLIPLAHGSDGGGSIRIPASVCGLVGLKPSRGRVSKAPLHADIAGLSVSGPLATSVRDAALFLDAIAGPAPGDALWADPMATGDSFRAWCDRDPGHLRIAHFATPMIAGTTLDPQVRSVYDDLVDRLSGLGHTLVEIEVPLPADTVPVFETVWSVSAALAPVRADREHLLRPLTRWLRDRGRAASAPDYGKALTAMAQTGAKAVASLAAYDAVLTPTLAQLPAPVGALRNDADPAADFEAQKAFSPYTSGWNVTGMPAISLPTGWSGTGLPIGMMLAAAPGQEQVLCALGAQVESVLSTAGDAEGWSRPSVVL